MKNGKHMILYIEDDPDLQDSMRLVLEKHGYDLVSARTAEDGVKAFKKSQPDLVIVDLMMEEIDAGMNAVKELRALGNTAPIYLLSSIGDNFSTVADSAELGLSGIFQKPLDNDKLLKILEQKLT